MLPALIESILEIEEVRRFRLSSIEPASVSDEIITLMAESPKFARHFHIPFQSGSDSVLARMKRRYRAGEFADLVARISERIPGCGIGADVICGFPGETDDDFLRTFESVEMLPITYLHVFTYSSRPRIGSGALRGPGIRTRSGSGAPRALKRLAAEKQRRFAQRHVGRIMEVLLEPARRGGYPLASAAWTRQLPPGRPRGEGEAEARLEAGRDYRTGRRRTDRDLCFRPQFIRNRRRGAGEHRRVTCPRKKSPPGSGIVKISRHPVGVSADILVGARHDLRMEPRPCLHARSSTRRSALESPAHSPPVLPVQTSLFPPSAPRGVGWRCRCPFTRTSSPRS